MNTTDINVLCPLLMLGFHDLDFDVKLLVSAMLLLSLLIFII